MRILVAYATANGSTQGIAERIGERLAVAGWEVDVRAVEEVDAIDGYSGVILGSAVHDASWLPTATSFVRRHRAGLVRRPVWLFSVSAVGDSSSFVSPRVAHTLRQLASEPKGVPLIRRAVRAEGHRNFSGAVERPQWGLKGRLFLKATGGRYGDHRDWADIEDWADGIASALRSAPKATSA